MATRILGLLFFFSALAKGVDVEGFGIQVAAYGIVRTPWQVQSIAFVTIIGEAILGGLFLGAKRIGRTLHILTLVLLSVFSLLIFQAWQFNNLSDCGCFGSLLSMPPPVSIGKNFLLIGALLYAWKRESWIPSFAGTGSFPTEFGAPFLEGEDKSFHSGTHESCMPVDPLQKPENAFVWGRSVWTTVIAGCLLIFAAAFGYSLHNTTVSENHTDPIVLDADDPGRPFAGFVFENDETHYDLSEGDYLVALLSATCSHCEEETNRLSELPELFPDAPPVVGLCMGTAAELKTFREKTIPNFPTVRLDPLAFFQLIGQAPPRFVLIRDGKSVRYWDEHMPELLELAEALQ